MTKGTKLSRYKNVYQILNLAIWIQSRMQGASLSEIAEKLEVSRRTAERIRDCLLDIFYPNFDEIPIDGNIKRWGFKSFIPSLVNFSADDLLELENLKNIAPESSNKTVQEIIDKIKTLNKNSLNKIENDLEVLLEAEGFAISQKAKQKINTQIILTIREAIKAQKHLTFEYKKQAGFYPVKAAPYGLIYGNKTHLVAFDNKDKKLKHYLLSKMKTLDIADKYFEKDENFNLKEYDSRSFGVYQEEQKHVKIVFDAKFAEDVLNYHFHPTQKMTILDNQDILVEFTAGGTVAICWELFKWGDSIKLIEPAELKEEYLSMIKKVSNNLY